MLKRGDKRKRKQREEFPYNGETAHWWLQRSLESGHKRAYRNIADYIRASYSRDPGLIVDYACGAGNLLSLLSRRFPNSRLLGLDGSSYLLERAARRFSRLPGSCAQRISLKEIPLPSFDFQCGGADLVIFCFPNMTPYSGDEDWRVPVSRGSDVDQVIARILSPDASRILEWSRYISYNLRRLLVRGGLCIRIEYATVQRHELSLPELLPVAFEEGSLDTEVEGRMPRQWFQLLASSYFRSQVLEDVYQQTDDERDTNGGYLITVLRAI